MKAVDMAAGGKETSGDTSLSTRSSFYRPSEYIPTPGQRERERWEDTSPEQLKKTVVLFFLSQFLSDFWSRNGVWTRPCCAVDWEEVMGPGRETREFLSPVLMC